MAAAEHEGSGVEGDGQQSPSMQHTGQAAIEVDGPEEDRAEERFRNEEAGNTPTSTIDGLASPANLSNRTSTMCLDNCAVDRHSSADALEDPEPLSKTVSPSPPVQSPERSSPRKPPLSFRARDRGFSLRRSILARNVHGHPESTGSAFELQPANQRRPRTPASSNTSGTKEAATVIVSPAVEQYGEAERVEQLATKAHGPLSLPHYESWVQGKAARSGPFTRLRNFKENIRRIILGVHDVPPSKNGRHIEFDLSRRKALIDERKGHEYVDNTIRSSRFTLWNFLPRQLFAQFSKLANFYFLCVSILQMIPGLSTTGTYTTIVPLSFFVMISMAKEGYDDLRRYRLDKAENMKTTYVLHAYGPTSVASDQNSDTISTIDGPNHWAQTKWENVRVGDVVKLQRDEAAPADLVVLQAMGTEGKAYVETMALDGETNLKSKQPPPPLAGICKTVDDIAQCNAHLVVEDPNLDLYTFEGNVTVGDKTLPLTNFEIIYRGSVLRNTSEVMGMAIYTGEECKIRMNATKNPRIKAPALQAAVNKIVIILVIFVFALAIFNTVAYQIWQEKKEEHAWYLANAAVAFFPILISFIILFNTMIPLSLYVSLEIVKLFQMYLLNDIEMYDMDSRTPMEARTSTINEELGQVNYIFSDKTGTLTNNSMRFRKISVEGTAWLHDPDIQEETIKVAASRSTLQDRCSKGKKPLRRRISTSSSAVRQKEQSVSPTSCSSPAIRNSSVTSRWKSSARPDGPQPVLSTVELLQYIQHKPHTVFARKVRFFLLSMALCHTCFPEQNVGGEVDYQAASPDEQALVRAAQELGYIVIDRESSNITIKTYPSGHKGEALLERYQVLDVIEFSSARKRMSIIVRLPIQRICVFCKGADSVIMERLRLSGLAIAKAVEVEQKAGTRQSIEAQEAIRRASENHSPETSIAGAGMSVQRPSLGGTGHPSTNARRLHPTRDEVDRWLRDRETDIDMSPRNSESIYRSPRPSAQIRGRYPHSSLDGRPSHQYDDMDELVEEAMVIDDAAVFARCFQHINDFATEGLRTLLYGYRYIEEDEYNSWKKTYLDASTSLTCRQDKIEMAGAMIERNFELAGATAIEDKLQKGVPETIDKLRRAGIKLWMLTGDKRETAINIGRSCRLIKDYSAITTLDHELGDVSQCIAAATLDCNNNLIAHSVLVVDGQTLSQITSSESLRKLFLSLAILVDTVICCRASPSQKASLVHSIRSKVKNAITLAIGDGANDIAMIQEAHVGIGITGKEGLQAARTSDYSIAQFRFLARLLLVHGRWNYIRTCKYTLGTFWKEMLFYLTQALYQRYAGYTGTSLYESWSLSMFNTLFTSLPVIFMGIFEQDLSASTLMAVPELYHSVGPRNASFNIPLYLGWVAMASSEAVVVFFIMLGLYGQALFTTDNGLFAMGALAFTACIIIIASKMQFWEIHNKTYTCVIAMFLSIGGWFLWNIILSAIYKNNAIYDVKEGFLQRFGRNALWWLTLMLIVTSCWALEICVKTVKATWFPSDADCFRELEKDPAIRQRFEQAAGMIERHTTGPIVSGPLEHVRTAEEDMQREGEMQEILDRPRHMKRFSGIGEQEFEGIPRARRRQTSVSEGNPHDHRVSFPQDVRHDVSEDPDNEDTNGKNQKRRSIDVQELLIRGFGNVRRSLDLT